jgi:hypothetical protein
MSEDIFSEDETIAKKSKMSNSKTSIRIRFQEPKAIGKEITSEKCHDVEDIQVEVAKEEQLSSAPSVNYFLYINRLIWLAYCICSVRVNSISSNEYGWVEVAEAINGLAVVLTLSFSCYNDWNITPIISIHLVSMVLTLGFYLSMEEPLHTVISVCRCVRILLIFLL